jgi:myo-inositol-1(or 4)-monophosphatase
MASWTECIGCRPAPRLLDGYWERTQPWDIAARQIMVREAGGTISGIEGSDDPLKTGHVLCGNEYVHGELVKILKALDK